MQRKEVNADDRRTKYTRSIIRDAFMELLKKKPYSKISVTEICRIADINRGTFYIHYYDVDDVLDDILDLTFSDVTGALDHVLCQNKENCTYPLCQKVHENAELWPLFMDDMISQRIIKRISDKSKESFISSLMQKSTLTYEQAEAVFYFQINGCLTINRLTLKNKCRDWHSVQQAIDRFIRGGLEEFIDERE